MKIILRSICCKRRQIVIVLELFFHAAGKISYKLLYEWKFAKSGSISESAASPIVQILVNRALVNLKEEDIVKKRWVVDFNCMWLLCHPVWSRFHLTVLNDINIRWKQKLILKQKAAISCFDPRTKLRINLPVLAMNLTRNKYCDFIFHAWLSTRKYLKLIMKHLVWHRCKSICINYYQFTVQWFMLRLCCYPCVIGKWFVRSIAGLVNKQSSLSLTLCNLLASFSRQAN